MEIQDLENVAAYGTHLPSGWETAPGMENAKQLKSNARNTLDTFEKRAAEVNADPFLTETGKQDQLHRLKGQHQSTLASLKDDLTSLKHVRDLERGQVIGEMKAHDNDTANRQAEIRALLPDDPLLVRRTYMNALEDGDNETMAAIENMPRLHQGRPHDNELEELKQFRLDGNMTTRFKNLDAAYQEIDNLVHFLEENIADEIG